MWNSLACVHTLNLSGHTSLIIAQGLSVQFITTQLTVKFGMQTSETYRLIFFQYSFFSIRNYQFLSVCSSCFFTVITLNYSRKFPQTPPNKYIWDTTFIVHENMCCNGTFQNFGSVSKSSGKQRICDWTSENGPSGHIKFHYISQICCQCSFKTIEVRVLP